NAALLSESRRRSHGQCRGEDCPPADVVFTFHRYSPEFSRVSLHCVAQRYRVARSLGRMQCLLLALNGHIEAGWRCPLSGVKRTKPKRDALSAFDPKRTLSGLKSRNAAVGVWYHPPLHEWPPSGGSHGKLHRTTKVLSHARRRGRVAARGARAAARADAADWHRDALPEKRHGISIVRSGFPGGIGKAGMVRGRERSIRRALVDGRHGYGEADAANLVELNPNVIVIVGDRVIPVLTKLTRSIPIVVALTTDPIASGAVESLARPGRNVTGFSLIEFSIFGKMLETLKRLAPGISRVGMMYNPDNPVGDASLRAFEMVAEPLAVQPINLPIHDLADIERAIASLAEQANGGVLIPPDVTVQSLRRQVSALLARYRVPAISTYSALTAAGGLVSYGPD